MCETASLYSVLGKALYLLLHWKDLGGICISLLEEGPLLVVSVVEVGCIAVVCSMNVMGVDFIVPVMMRSV